MPYSRKTRTPRRKERRRRQFSRLGYDNDRILDILDYEFGLGLGLILGSVLVFLQLKLSLLMITETLAYPVSFDFQNYINVIIITFLLGLIASFSVSSYVKKWLD